jgi:DNA-binding PadR family transcriptional regulator
MNQDKYQDPYEDRGPRDGGRRRRPPFGDFDPQRGRGRRGWPPFGEERFGGGRLRRGDVRSALLIALLDGPAHGYEHIQGLEAKTDGRWRPSPGSVYPQLQLLADEGLVTSTEQDGKRVFEITEAGRQAANERIEAQGYPWDAMDRGRGEHGELRVAVRDLHNAVKQIGLSGTPETVQRATEILTTARKDLYRLLAE